MPLVDDVEALPNENVVRKKPFFPAGKKQAFGEAVSKCRKGKPAPQRRPTKKGGLAAGGFMRAD